MNAFNEHPTLSDASVRTATNADRELELIQREILTGSMMRNWADYAELLSWRRHQLVKLPVVPMKFKK